MKEYINGGMVLMIIKDKIKCNCGMILVDDGIDNEDDKIYCPRCLEQAVKSSLDKRNDEVKRIMENFKFSKPCDGIEEMINEILKEILKRLGLK